MVNGRFRRVAAREMRGTHFVAMLCMGPIAGVAITGLREIGLVAPSPVWLIPVLVVGGQAVSTMAHLAWQTWQTRAWLHARVASQAVIVTATIYATGWGPGLSVGLLLVGQESLATAGSTAQRVVLGWNLMCLAVGQAVLALGWAPSLLPIPEVHGLALLMGIGIAFSYRSLTSALVENERAAALIERREHRFRALVQSSHDLVFVVDRTAAVTYASPSCLEILGYEPGALLGSDSGRLVHENDLEHVRAAIGRCHAEPGSNAEFSMRVRRSDGVWRWLEGNATNLLEDPAVLGLVVNARDVTDRKIWAEQQAAIAELDRFALRATSIKALSDTAAAAVARVLEVPACRVLSDPTDASVAAPGTRRVPIGDPLDPMGQIEVGDARALTELEDRFVEAVASILLLAMVRSRAEEAIRHQAIHDPLTGLPNRTLFNDRLEHAVQRRARVAGWFAVLIADLDGFKNVNDSLGHQAGDALLTSVADRFRSSLRDVDTIARLGGDEFAVLVDDLESPDEARQVAQRILDSLVDPVPVAGRSVAIGVSVGIAFGGAPDDTSEGLLGAADSAMYRAKREGKGCYREFEASMHAAAVERMDLEQALRSAVLDPDFTVHYQPVVDARTGAVVAFEALARWSHPTRGPILPEVFIPLAEELGLIVEIGRRVLFEACHQARAWHDAHPGLRPAVAVNVSVRQLVHPGFAADVAAALATAKLSPTALTIEVTESALASDSGRVVGVLNRLRATGVRVAIDDFGTGYSSFATLSELPIDILKIDKRFIDNLGVDEERRGIVGAIIQLAHTLHLETIAEGVEQHEQRHALQQLGCPLVQGYLVAGPMPGDQTLRFMEDAPVPVASLERPAHA
ncbi:MAG: putative bifunctional diguanylate cyclase/phosphodiesterase [Microthrixaceae bacterium]